MVAALPAISAGVSVVQGLSGLAAKNKAASAQREQLSIQQQQNQSASLAARQRLFVQQQQNEREYIMNDLSARSANQQQQFGMEAQSLLASFEAQRQRSNINQSMLGVEQQTLQSVDQLARQAASNTTGASGQRQQAYKKEAAQQDEFAGAEQQVQKMLSDSERQLLAQQASQDRTMSSTVKADSARMRMLANTLSVGLDIDKSSVESMLQGANERDITTMMEQLAGSDNEFNQQRVAANLRLARQQADGQLQTLNFNDSQQQKAYGTAQQYQQINAQSDAVNRASTEASQRKDYAIQQESIATTGNLVEQSLATQKKQVKGASLIDYIATGVNAYAAVAPLAGKSSSSQPSGAPSYIPSVSQSGGYQSQSGIA